MADTTGLVSQSANSQEGRIKPLNEHIVNQIAAGEVVQRPAFALKELVENSIDAGATQISILVNEGGLKLLQIKDNGCGIHAEDFPILCQRHTTSKLKEHDDLKHISTLGFRGEALCSVSFVSRLKIVSMRADASMGYKAEFRDSVMTTEEPERCAAVQGTCIIVEDMFYNVPSRRKALSNPGHEFRLMFDVIAKYAVFCKGVGFSLKRHGINQSDIQTLPQHSRRDVIRSIFGATVKDNLIEVADKLNWPQEHTEVPPAPSQEPMFSVEGLVTSQNARCKKTHFLLFVNGRPVDCSPLKSSLEAIYASLHAKSTTFWAFLDVRIPFEHVDVNVHPTKSEVMFLHEQELVDMIKQAVENALEQSQGVRTLPKGSATNVSKLSENNGALDNAADAKTPGSTQRARAGGDHKFVRTDHRTQSIKDAIHSAAESQRAALSGTTRRRGHVRRGTGDTSNTLQQLDVEWNAAAAPPEMAETLKRAPILKGALEEMENQTHVALTQALREHTFVGHVGQNSVLIQHATKLLLVDLSPLSKDLMYQQALLNHGALESIILDDAPLVKDLLDIGLEEREARGEMNAEDDNLEELRDMMLAVIGMHRQELKEAIGVIIDEEMHLTALPAIISSYCPHMDNLPEFLISIAVDVPWSESAGKLVQLAKLVGELYAWSGVAFESSLSTVTDDAPNEEKGHPDSHAKEWIVESVLLKSMKKRLHVPFSRASDGTFVEVASLGQIYRIFERC